MRRRATCSPRRTARDRLTATTPTGPRFEAFLDTVLPAGGAARVTRIGDGASNLTYLVERAGARAVVRRPPPPPLPPSAHDVVREARLQLALHDRGVRVPRVLAVCEDPAVAGAPFYVMEEIGGSIVTDALPTALSGEAVRRGLGFALVDALAELHAVDWRTGPLGAFGRADGYLERQIRRFSSLQASAEGRPLPGFEALTDDLRRAIPDTDGTTVVHGDYRLGNVMVGAGPQPDVAAILDWEMATLGDPLADLGYLTVTWSDPDVDPHPMLLSPATALPGFPSRADLVRHYAARTGRDVSRLGWYQALALWKSAVFCEAIHTRFRRGERGDRWAASLGAGVPRLIEAATACLAQA